MGQPAHNLAHIPRELRGSNLGYGLGASRLVKLPSPALGFSFTRTVPSDNWERILSLSFTLTTGATAGLRTVAINFLDGDGSIFNTTPVVGAVGPSQVVPAFADLVTVTPLNARATQYVAGFVTTPGAGATIAQLPVLPAGWWDIAIQAGFGGTIESTTGDNLQLKLGATVVTTALLLIGFGPNTVRPLATIRALSDGINQFTLVSPVAASAGAVYLASMQADAVTSAQVTIPDLLLHSGWAWSVTVGGVQATDQLSGIEIMAERFPSDLAGGYPRPDGQLFYPGPP